MGERCPRPPPVLVLFLPGGRWSRQPEISKENHGRTVLRLGITDMTGKKKKKKKSRPFSSTPGHRNKKRKRKRIRETIGGFVLVVPANVGVWMDMG